MMTLTTNVTIGMNDADAKALLKLLGGRTRQDDGERIGLSAAECQSLDDLYVRLRETFFNGLE